MLEKPAVAVKVTEISKWLSSVASSSLADAVLKSNLSSNRLAAHTAYTEWGRENLRDFVRKQQFRNFFFISLLYYNARHINL